MNEKPKKVLNSFEMAEQVEQATKKFKDSLNSYQQAYLNFLIEVNRDLEAFDAGLLTTDGLKEFNWMIEQLQDLAIDLRL